jgi:hypothetical protein
MKLIIYFGGLCMLLNECVDFLQLTLVSSFKSGRVVEDKLQIALRGEWAIDIVDAALMSTKMK